MAHVVLIQQRVEVLYRLALLGEPASDTCHSHSKRNRQLAWPRWVLSDSTVSDSDAQRAGRHLHY